MSGATVFDLTDARFKTDVNADVMAFVRELNPFAHSDLGQLLIDLSRALPAVSHYCPSYGSCAYVVLHDASDRIFAVAWDMSGLALRIDDGAARLEAISDGGYAASAVGPQWVGFDPWKVDEPTPVTRQRLARWAVRAAGRSGASVPRP